MSKFKRFILYFGIEPANYELVKPKIYWANLFITAFTAICATVLITSMYISTYFVEGIVENRPVYLTGAILSIIVVILALFYGRKHTWIVVPLVHLADFIYFTYGILLGVVTDPDQKTVTFIVMLVFLPVLFIDRPIRCAINTLLYIIIFIYLCFKTKTGAVLQNDVIDAAVFGTLGIVSGIIINRMKVYGYVMEYKLQEVSRYDQLTQINNRNAYELTLASIPDYAVHNLSCIYIDVNGLHELNNEEGHASGDEMLKFVAEQIKMYFGEELSFRIGGDEFVTFVVDTSKTKVIQDLDEMVANIEQAGYHVATGLETVDVHRLSIENLIKTAESRMYQDKKQFYKNRANDRRRE